MAFATALLQLFIRAGMDLLHIQNDIGRDNDTNYVSDISHVKVYTILPFRIYLYLFVFYRFMKKIPKKDCCVSTVFFIYGIEQRFRWRFRRG